MAKNINKKPFDEATKLKLDIFRECFREWLPVFIHNPYIDRIFIYDFFAGSGSDIEGTPGSPIILLEEAKGENCKVCNSVKNKQIVFGFNELLDDKNKELETSIKTFVEKCISQNCKEKDCQYKQHIAKLEFKDAFNSDNFKKILKNDKIAKFILLDQYGFSQVDENIFKELVDSPKTDFIFFISSSFIQRFREHENTKKHIDTSKIDFEKCTPKERHRVIANYFRGLINKSEYYIHHFSIKKGANHYGLIFGSSHSLGMEKFLKVCWDKDIYAGESSDNINNDYVKGSLFHNPDESFKKEEIRAKIREMILNKEITDNISGFKFTLSQLCQPKLFTEVVKSLEKDKLIKRVGDLNYQSVNIHDCKLYKIET